jgi:gluconolactonase
LSATTPSVTGLTRIGEGVSRPEHVLVDRDGRLYASDKASAVAGIDPDGGLRRLGDAGGEPNGIALTRDGHFLIANFGHGVLQELDPVSGSIETLVRDQIEGRPLQWLNFVLVDSNRTIWGSVSTTDPDLVHSIGHGEGDGYLFRLGAGETAPTVVADGVNFPNCMALDRTETYLYAVRTTAADVVRFRIDGNRLGPPETFGPPLGDRRPDEYGDHAMALLGDPEVARRWGMADGCGFDDEDNLWVTLVMSNRIVAITPARQVVTVADDPDGSVLLAPTSVAWGGPDRRDVYIGSMTAPYVVKGRSSLPGMPMVHQR